MTALTPSELGAHGEQLAVDHLTDHGWVILARNWRCRYGELDVIVADIAAHTVVFVEVKTRRGDGFGGLDYAVPPPKLRRLRRLAGVWLAAQQVHWEVVRLDVIRVRVGPGHTAQITHLRGVG